MEKLQKSHPVEVQWRSFELRPAGTAVSPEYRARIETVLRPRMEKMARDQYGLEINSGPFGIDSRPALVGAKFAEANDAGPAYHQGVLEAYWRDAENIEDHDVLVEIAGRAGLKKEPFIEALQSETYQKQVQYDIDQAFRYGLSGVPALIFENKYLVSGAQPYAVLVQVVEKILEERETAVGEP